MRFKQAIQIGDNVTDIMKLRCISFVSKNPFLGIEGWYHYFLYPGMMHDYEEDESHCFVAHKGDWLCEDANGHWHILCDNEYKALNENEENSHEIR